MTGLMATSGQGGLIGQMLNPAQSSGSQGIDHSADRDIAAAFGIPMAPARKTPDYLGKDMAAAQEIIASLAAARAQEAPMPPLTAMQPQPAPGAPIPMAKPGAGGAIGMKDGGCAGGRKRRYALGGLVMPADPRLMAAAPMMAPGGAIGAPAANDATGALARPLAPQPPVAPIAPASPLPPTMDSGAMNGALPLGGAAIAPIQPDQPGQVLPMGGGALAPIGTQNGALASTPTPAAPAAPMPQPVGAIGRRPQPMQRMQARSGMPARGRDRGAIGGLKDGGEVGLKDLTTPGMASRTLDLYKGILGGLADGGEVNVKDLSRPGEATRTLDLYKSEIGGLADGGIAGVMAEHQMQGDMAGAAMGQLALRADGGRMVEGPGDGRSDSVPVALDDGTPGRVADGEYVLPAWYVSAQGGGSTEAGARKIDAAVTAEKQRWSKKVGAFGPPAKGGKKKFLGGLMGGEKVKEKKVNKDAGRYLSNSLAQAVKGEAQDKIAGFNADQKRAFQMARDLTTGNQDGYYDTLQDGQNLLMGAFDPSGSNQAWDDNLIQASLGDFDRAQSITDAQTNRERAGRGAFGSRRALMEGENDTEYARKRSLLGSQLREEGLNRRTAAAREAAALAGQQRQSRVGDISLISDVGGQQQAQQQKYNDAEWAQAERLSNIYNGMPAGTTAQTNNSPLKAVLGTAAMAAGAYFAPATGGASLAAATAANQQMQGAKDGGMLRPKGRGKRGKRGKRKGAIGIGDEASGAGGMAFADGGTTARRKGWYEPGYIGQELGLPTLTDMYRYVTGDGTSPRLKNLPPAPQPPDANDVEGTSGYNMADEPQMRKKLPSILDVPAAAARWWEGPDSGVGMPGPEERAAMKSPPMLNPMAPEAALPPEPDGPAVAGGFSVIPRSRPAEPPRKAGAIGAPKPAMPAQLASPETDSGAQPAAGGKGDDMIAMLMESLKKPAADPAAAAPAAGPQGGGEEPASWGEGFMASPFTRFGLELLGSDDPTLFGAIGKAGVKTMQGMDQTKAQKRADRALAIKDAREERMANSAERTAERQDEATRTGMIKAIADIQHAQTTEQRQAGEAAALQAYRDQRLNQFNRGLGIQAQNSERLAKAGAIGDTRAAAMDPAQRAALTQIGNSIAEAEANGDTEEANRLRGVLAKMQGVGVGGGAAAPPPEGFELDGEEP